MGGASARSTLAGESLGASYAPNRECRIERHGSLRREQDSSQPLDGFIELTAKKLTGSVHDDSRAGSKQTVRANPAVLSESNGDEVG